MNAYQLDECVTDLQVLYGTGDLKKPDNTAMQDALTNALDQAFLSYLIQQEKEHWSRQ